MAKRNGQRAPSARPTTDSISPLFSQFLVLAVLVSVVLAGCASPGEPIERKPLVPQAITDLAAAQSGNDIVLTFTLPTESVDRRPLDQAPAIEIYRDFEPLSGAGGSHPAVPKNPTSLVTIPAAMVDRYAAQGRIRYSDPIPADIYAANAESVPVYVVRTRVSEKKASVDSNVATLRPVPMPEPIADLRADVTQSAVVLKWTAPQKSPVGAAQFSGYRAYRAETEPGATAETSKTKSPPTLIGESDATVPSFNDSNVEFGKTYTYIVRSVVQTPNGPQESGDSNSVVVTPKDTFPPAAPQGLVVVLVPTQGDVPAHLELSWAISPESDIAGYCVYRSDQEGTPGVRVTGNEASKLLLTPAFRDMNVQPGRRYFYSVTAVDRSGNESSRSAAVSGGVPAEGQTTP